MWSPGPASSPLIPRATRFGITSRPIDRGSSNTGQRLLAVTSLTTHPLYPDVVFPVSCWFSARTEAVITGLRCIRGPNGTVRGTTPPSETIDDQHSGGESKP